VHAAFRAQRLTQEQGSSPTREGFCFWGQWNVRPRKSRRSFCAPLHTPRLPAHVRPRSCDRCHRIRTLVLVRTSGPSSRRAHRVQGHMWQGGALGPIDVEAVTGMTGRDVGVKRIIQGKEREGRGWVRAVFRRARA